jgi:hypothetical protein
MRSLKAVWWWNNKGEPEREEAMPVPVVQVAQLEVTKKIIMMSRD